MSEEELLSKEETVKVVQAMGEMFPDAKAELNHDSPFELLIAVILSAQTTDVGVNRVLPGLFEAYPTPEAMMEAPVEEIMDKIKTIGLYRNKAKFIKSCSRDLVEKFSSEVPANRKDLMSLKGVGRKTANVVMSVAFDEPAIAVDTHVERISKKFHIAEEDASVTKVEKTLMEKLPEDMWSKAHHVLIFFGRYQCPARSHNHEDCIQKVKMNMPED